MTSERTSHWDTVYATRAETDVGWFQAIPTPSLDLLDLIGASPASAVIDIGGGASRLVDSLAERGFRDLTVLDLSAIALRIAETRLGEIGGEIDWIVADVTEWEPNRTWDVWHDRAAFHFLLSEEDRRAYVRRLRQALAPGGHAIIATFAPDGPEKCSGLPVRRQDTRALATLLGEEFAVVRSRDQTHLTPGGGAQNFQFSVFRRTA